MTDPAAVAIRWSPEAPPNRRRWEAEIKSALSAPIGVADVEMVQDGPRWRVESAKVGGIAEMRDAVTEYLVAMGFPVSS